MHWKLERAETLAEDERRGWKRREGGRTGHPNGVYGLAALARGPVEHAVCVWC